MSHIRITATADGREFVDRHVEVRSSDRLEAAVAEAATDVLGGPCLAREVRPEARPRRRAGRHVLTLYAYDGPRVAPGDSEAAAAAAKSRPIGRFEVVRATEKHPRKPWYASPRQKARASAPAPSSPAAVRQEARRRRQA